MSESHAHFRRQSERDHAAKVGKFASGGAVEKGVHEHESHLHKGAAKTKLKLKEGGAIKGEAGPKRLDRATGGRTKAKGNHVNVIIAPPGKDKPVPVPVPAGGPPPGAPPMGGPPPGGPPGGPPMPPPHPPMMPPGAGGPPMGPPPGMPMRATGGSVPTLTGGGGGATARLEKAKAYGGESKKGEGPVSSEDEEGPRATEDLEGKKRGGAC